MKVGDLVRITRASAGVKKDTVGLIVKIHKPEYDPGVSLCPRLEWYFVELCSALRPGQKRFTSGDLEVLA